MGGEISAGIRYHLTIIAEQVGEKQPTWSWSEYLEYSQKQNLNSH